MPKIVIYNDSNICSISVTEKQNVPGNMKQAQEVEYSKEMVSLLIKLFGKLIKVDVKDSKESKGEQRTKPKEEA